MRRKILNDAKLIVTVEGNKETKEIKTISVYDNRTNEYLNKEYIKERNIELFLDIKDMKETLNWNLNGDDSKYQFKWGQSGKGFTEGRAYIFA